MSRPNKRTPFAAAVNVQNHVRHVFAVASPHSTRHHERLHVSCAHLNEASRLSPRSQLCFLFLQRTTSPYNSATRTLATLHFRVSRARHLRYVRFVTCRAVQPVGNTLYKTPLQLQGGTTPHLCHYGAGSKHCAPSHATTDKRFFVFVRYIVPQTRIQPHTSSMRLLPPYAFALMAVPRMASRSFIYRMQKGNVAHNMPRDSFRTFRTRPHTHVHLCRN